MRLFHTEDYQSTPEDFKNDEPFDAELDSVVFCHFCLLPALQRDAIEEGWTPVFYTRSDIEEGPACPSCTAKMLRKAKDGEMEEIS